MNEDTKGDKNMPYVVTIPCIAKGRKNVTIFDAERDLTDLIDEYMGVNMRNVFEEYVEEIKNLNDPESGWNWEAIADEYRRQLVDVMNDLHEALSQNRLNRKRIEEIYDRLKMKSKKQRSCCV